jgi:hypothetical protein
MKWLKDLWQKWKHQNEAVHTMTQEDLDEMQALYGALDRYKTALDQIESAPREFKLNPHKTKSIGMYEGLAAASRVAKRALKEKDDE